jgi:uncharacterized protein YeaO (DUF488 family)
MVMRIDVARKPITFMHCEERHPIFAPSWDLLMEYQRGAIAWEAYVERYLDEMRAAYRENPEAFQAMAQRLDDVVFVCWCSKTRPSDLRCHRFLLREILDQVKARSDRGTGAHVDSARG